MNTLPEAKGEYFVWVTCPKFTCLVKVRREWWGQTGNFMDFVIGGAPIVTKWIGKSFDRFKLQEGIERIEVLGQVVQSELAKTKKGLFE